MHVINLTQKNKSPIVLSRPGVYRAFMKNLSGTFEFVIESEGVDLTIYGIYKGANADTFRVHTIQRHVVGNSKSNLLIKGVFRDASRFHYTGLVKIHKDAQNSHAYQKNQNLLLSPDAFVESEPDLEIEANEVYCTHGSTTGRLSPAMIQYLMSRGIQYAAAQELLIEGFLNEIPLDYSNE